MESEKQKVKATPAEVAERVAEILRIRLDGAAFHDCVEFAREKSWSVSERQVGRYIEKADRALAKHQERRRSRIIAVHMARAEKLYARCVNAADLSTAARVLQDLGKLNDLYATSGDVRELTKLIATQSETIRGLEGRLNAPRTAQKDGAEKRPTAPGADGRDADGDGQVDDVPPRPGTSDG